MKEYNSLKIVLYIDTMFVLYPSIHLTLTFVQMKMNPQPKSKSKVSSCTNKQCFMIFMQLQLSDC